MHGVDPQIPGTTLRARFAPLADGNWRGPCRLIAGIAFAVSLGVAEAVDLRPGDLCNAFEGSLAVFLVLALQNVFGRWTAQVAVTPVHVGQQFHIRFRVSGGKLPALIRGHGHPPVRYIVADQACDLCSAQARHAGYISAYEALP